MMNKNNIFHEYISQINLFRSIIFVAKNCYRNFLLHWIEILAENLAKLRGQALVSDA